MFLFTGPNPLSYQFPYEKIVDRLEILSEQNFFASAYVSFKEIKISFVHNTLLSQSLLSL
jgi:hypothetical protein